MNIVCDNKDYKEVREKLDFCGIKYETSYYCEGKTYFAIWDATQDQIDLYESLIAQEKENNHDRV